MKSSLLLRLAGGILLTLAALAHAGPGAHGPNGEHLAATGAAGATSADSPRIEAHTELLELVGRLFDDELSVTIDRYETNEPVLAAEKVEVEFAGIKAVATLHADQGDFSFTDAALLKALSKPGKHTLVFTVIAGADSDLIEGVLEVQPPPSAPDGAVRPWWIAGAALLAVLLILLARTIWQRRRTAHLSRMGA